MAKWKMGFDIGNSSVKIAAVGPEGTELYEIRMPDNMMNEGEIAMPAAFSDFLKREMRKLGVPKGVCALVLPARQVICRTVTMPKMTTEQLILNLPYEFSEFIQGDTERFFCDYAMCDPEPTAAGEGESPEGEQMTMIAAAASKDRLAQYLRIFSGAGLKLRTILPGEMALIQLVKSYRARRPDRPDEYCFVNLGQDAVGITIIRGDRLQATRQIDFGCGQIDRVIADLTNADQFLASTYKLSNFQGILDSPECDNVYQSIAVEILKVVNFYRFHYRDSELPGVYLAGGGALIWQLRERITEILGLPLLAVEELIPDGTLEAESAARGILAVGVTTA